MLNQTQLDKADSDDLPVWSALTHPRVWTMLMLGFCAGLPLLLIFSSLSLWLREAGVARSSVTFFSWAALGYSFKFVWAPLVDTLPLPVLHRWLGRRRSWMLLAQIGIMIAMVAMALTDPKTSSLTTMAIAAVMLGFSSATQDIVIDAYRIEAAGRRLQAMLSSSYIAGYRIGMLVSGAGALFIAQELGSSSDVYSYSAWRTTYLIMAAFMLIGVATTLIIREPDNQRSNTDHYTSADYLRFVLLFAMAVAGFVLVFFFTAELAGKLSTTLAGQLNNKVLAGLIVETLRLTLGLFVALLIGRGLVSAGVVSDRMLDATYVAPVRDFFKRYGVGLSLLLLGLIGCYRISDIVLGVVSNVFYQDLGFTKKEIASVVKTFGLLMTIVGGFAGGLLAMRFGVMRVLLLGAILSSLTNLLFIWLAMEGKDMQLIYLVISADNLSAGIATAAFVAFLSSLTSISFTAVQYAIFSSLMTLLPKVLGGYSGTMVENMGYPSFFWMTTLLGLPALVLVLIAMRHMQLDDKNE